jgi:hypothetical protein
MKWMALFAALPLLGQPSQLAFVGSTSTQIVFSYQAPDSNACAIAAVNDDDSSVAVYDLDSTLFPGTPAVNTDFRHDWNIGRRGRIVVLGKRASDTGSDGRLYSRALEVDANHTITVTCTGGSGTLKARSGKLPVGYTYQDSPPFNSSGFANWGWPSIDWSNRGKPLIDPMTGVKIKFVTFPRDLANRRDGRFGANYWVDWSGGHWANPGNAPSGSTSTLATYSGGGNEALFLGVDPALSVSNRMYGGWPGGYPFSADDFGVHILGSASDTSSTNRAVNICLSIDSGQSCYTRTYLVILPQGNAADTGVQPPSFPSPMWAGWGKAIPRGFLPTSGTADVAGNQLTLTGTQNGDTFFNPELPSGSKIRIAGSSAVCAHELCTVQSVQDGTHLVLAENLNLTGAAFTLSNFGVRIMKTTGTGTVSLSAWWENAWSSGFIMPVSGSTDMCSLIPVQVHVDAAGNPLPAGQVLTGYNCGVSGRWYWISPETGESRLISVSAVPAASAFSGVDPRDVPSSIQAPPGVTAFDLQQPNVAYTFAELSQGGRSVFRMTYNGDYRAFDYNYPYGNGGELPTSISDGIVWTNISPASQGKDIMTQVRSRFPSYDETRFGQVTEFFGISGDYAMFLHNIGGQDSPCWVFLFNIKTQVLEQGFNSWDGTYSPVFRWAACHSGEPGFAPNLATVSTKPLYLGSNMRNYAGPFGAPVTAVLRSGGTFDSNTAIAQLPDSSYETTCPSGLNGPYASLAGTNQCVTIRVGGEPCSAFATANEKAWSPCPWDSNKSMLQTMEVGDSLANVNGGYNSERMTIAKKTILSVNSIELVLKRNIGPDCGVIPVQRVYPNGWQFFIPSGGFNACEGGLEFVDPLNRQVLVEDPHLLLGHFDHGVGTRPNSYSVVGVGNFGGQYPYAIRDNKPLSAIGQPADYYISQEPKFANASNISFSFLQIYSSKKQWTAPDVERRWSLDFRHLNGSFGIPFESSSTTLAQIQTALVPGTSHVYQISVLGGTDVKKVPILGYAGRFLLKEKSGPTVGDTLTDSDNYRFCYAYRNGECRQNSTAGQAFVSVPGATITGYCQSATYARSIPCLMSSHPWGGWAIQVDTSKQDMKAAGVRRLTMGLMGPGRQYAYGNLRSLPNGKWAMMSGWWLEGLRTDILLIKLPPFPEGDSTNRSDFVPVKVAIGAAPGAARAVVDFGYAEFAAPSSFQCTPRAEGCSAASATINRANPFLFASELTQGLACANGCTIQVPALPAHVLYYQVRYLDNAGATVQTLPLQILASPETGG